MTSGKTWRKSNYSAPDNNCVELAIRQGDTDVRDSKSSDSNGFTVTSTAWAAFLASAKSDGFRR